jgi:hypothetical protein
VFPGKIRLHLILNNSGTDKQGKVRDGLKRRPLLCTSPRPDKPQLAAFNRTLLRRVGREGHPTRRISQRQRPELRYRWKQGPHE